MTAPSTEVGPGFLAFVAFFFLAVALWLLMRNMFTRLRRMNHAESDRVRQGQQRDDGPIDPQDSAERGDRTGESERRSDEV